MADSFRMTFLPRLLKLSSFSQSANVYPSSLFYASRMGNFIFSCESQIDRLYTLIPREGISKDVTESGDDEIGA